MAILGLTSTATQTGHLASSHRRKVFYNYPNGAAPLIGLLSLMESEVTDNPAFSWFEHRWAERTTTVMSGLQFYTAASGTDLTSTTTAGNPVTFTAGLPFQLRTVANGVKYLRVGDVITIFGVTLTGPVTRDLKMRVTAVDYTNLDRLVGIVLETPSATVVNGATNDGRTVRVTGSAHEEGGTSVHRLGKYPVEPLNYTQIFKTSFSFTRTALKEPLKWDKSGGYKSRAKEEALNHMVDMENAALWGIRTSTTMVNEDGEVVPIRTTGGVEWFLQQWEKGNTTNGGAFDYREGAAATLNTDINKRIIDLSGQSNTATRKEFEGYLQRVFSSSNNKTNEKLVLCGPGFLSTINTTYEKQIMTTRTMGKKDDEVYGMNLVGVQTVHGMAWFKSHPLFAQRPDMNYSALILDVGNLKYRYLTDSDTELYKNRQHAGQDRRKDEWLTESGLEVRFPESHMYMKNVETITP